MAVREYVGARYVPKFMGEYSPTTAYEALSVVDDGLGTSYTSKIPVPPGTPLTDTEYWALTGSLNGAILHLQDEIDDINDDIDDINNYKVIATLPEAYGAIGDGIADDTAAIQDALDNNKLVYLPNKTYRITDTITVPDGVSLVGIGSILIDYTTEYDAIVLSGNNTLKGISFSDTGSSYIKSYSAVTAIQTENIDICYCKFNDIHLGYAIRIEYSKHINVCNNSIDEYSYAGIVFASTCKYITVNKNSVINGNFVDSGHNRYPICVSAYGDISTNHGPAEFVECNYNYISDDSAIWEGIDSHGVINAEFVGNTIIGTTFGISLTKPTSAGSLTKNGWNVSIRDNYIEHDEAAWGSPYGKTAIGVNVEFDLYNLTIDNNYCNMVTDSGVTQISTGTHEIVVSASDASAYMNNIKITNNYIHQKGGGISITSINVAQGIEISNNRITGLGLGTSSVAINLHDVTKSYSDIRIMGNYILASHSDAYSFRGNTTNEAHRMIKYKDNTDNGKYLEDKHCLCAKSSYTTSNNEGENGDFIPCSVTGTTIGWFCQTRGTWKAITV